MPTRTARLRDSAIAALLWPMTLSMALYAWLMSYPQQHPSAWGRGSMLQGIPEWLRNVVTRLVLMARPVRFEWSGRVPDQRERVLFVANHNVLGLDMPELWSVIYQSTGLWPRGLADTLHFAVPFNAHFLWWMGAIRGDANTYKQAMDANYPILVFPGGSYEVMKRRKDPKYHIAWRNRRGFVRYAIQHGYTIVPVALIGVQDMFPILWDIPAGWIARLFGDKRTDLSIPLVAPLGAWQFQYAVFGNPIETAHLQSAWQDEAVVGSIRDQVQQDVLRLMQQAIQTQQTDPDRFILWSAVRRLVGANTKRQPLRVRNG
ncbi:hypothetical protein BC831DRAFT_481510 [Entophlyctis helioformis]|nr:hypothetical protein BC831DRAFT_481510 [Entophlyctis helioformis]